MYFYNIINKHLKSLKNQIVAVIGGGGKSTLIKKISQELSTANFKVVITTTTKMQPFPNVGLVLRNGNTDYLSELSVILDELNIAQVANGYYKKGTLRGINQVTVNELTKYADIVLIEADGSRQRSLKTHKENEPIIPVNATTVIIISGANIVGEELNESTVHRAEIFSQKWNLPFGTILTPEIIAKELTSPYSYIRNIPLNSNIAYLINKSDLNSIGGKLLAEHLLRKCKNQVYWGSIKNNLVNQITI